MDENDDYTVGGGGAVVEDRGWREREGRGQNTILGLGQPMYAGTHICTVASRRRKIAELSTSGTLGTPLELHPFSRETSVSPDKLCTCAYIATN